MENAAEGRGDRHGDTTDMAKEKTLADAFYETLKDVYYAEKQSVKALKKSAKAAQDGELKQAFTDHAEESATQVERLTQVFELIGKPARAKTCEAMTGIVSEMEEDLEEFGGTEAADQVLIGCAQAVEHYEIARYGLLKTWATKLGHDEAAALFAETLAEEKAADQRLTEIAEGLGDAVAEADEMEADDDLEIEGEDDDAADETPVKAKKPAPKKKAA